MAIFHSASAIGQQAWDALGESGPFQSYCWAVYGERIMADRPPFYITVSLDGQPAGRGTFYLMRDEPLPLPRLVRGVVQSALRRWPLFLCRAPLSGASGLVLPAGPQRETARRLLAQAALEEAQRQKASFLLFDYVEAEELHAAGWLDGSTPITVSDPGMFLTVEWDSFDAYLAAAGKKGRQHYKRCLHAAEKIGIHIEHHQSVPSIDAAMPLIRGLEKRHRSAPNPWVRAMLENMSMVDGTFLEARIGNRLVGCGLLVYDQGTQIALTLGLAEDVPYVYFSLVYAGLQDALEKKVRRLRWGSGAYDVKSQLGFRPETNNHARVTPVQPFLRPLLRLAG